MSTIEVLASEAVRVIGPGLADAAGAGVRRLIERFVKRGGRFPDDPAERLAFLRRLAEEDPEFPALLERALVTAGVDRVEVEAQPDFLDRDELRARFSRPGIWVIAGAHESGKTALARQIAYDLRDELDGHAHVNLDDHRDGAVLRVAEVQQRVLRALGVREVAETEPEIDRQYRRAPLNRRCLLALDNLAGAEEAEALVHGWADATVLITTRQLNPDLRAWYAGEPAILGGVDPVSAVRILADRCGAERLDAEAAAVEELIQLCDSAPALLRQVGGRPRSGATRRARSPRRSGGSGPTRVSRRCS